jgi:cystathionine gamma-synthase
MVEGCYRRTQDFASQFLSRWNIETTFVPINDFAALEAAIQPNTRMIFTETPTNPYLRVIDLDRLVEIARPRGILTAIDSTFATPLGLRPLDFGLDLVIHSATKYLAGHNDILSGAVIGPAALLKPIEDTRGVLGCVSGAQDAYLLLRGLKTLALRFRQQCENATHLAHYLANHPAVAKIYYPGLPCHPDYEIAQRQLRCFGGVVSFELEGDKERTSRFIDRLQIPFIGPTLGGVESIVQQQALFISSDPVERRKVGISDNLVRYAVGIEDAADLIADLEQALA